MQALAETMKAKMMFNAHVETGFVSTLWTDLMELERTMPRTAEAEAVIEFIETAIVDLEDTANAMEVTPAQVRTLALAHASLRQAMVNLRA
jgi:hypothetical protein